jgi:hypothetical protein
MPLVLNQRATSLKMTSFLLDFWIPQACVFCLPSTSPKLNRYDGPRITTSAGQCSIMCGEVSSMLSTSDFKSRVILLTLSKWPQRKSHGLIFFLKPTFQVKNKLANSYKPVLGTFHVRSMANNLKVVTKWKCITWMMMSSEPNATQQV